MPARFWKPKLVYPVPRSVTVGPPMPIKGYGAVDNLGLVAALSLTSNQTADWSAERVILWDQADVDVYETFNGTVANQWEVPVALDGHLLLAVTCVHHQDLTGLGTEYIANRWHDSAGGTDSLTFTRIMYGPVAFNEYYETTSVPFVVSAGDYFRTASDSGTDTSSTVVASGNTWLRIFDFGKPGAAKPLGKAPICTNVLAVGTTGTNFTTEHDVAWDSAENDGGQMFDPCNPTVLTVPSQYDGYTILCQAYLAVNNITDQGYLLINHRDACGGLVGAGRKYIQHGGVGTGSAYRFTIPYAHHSVSTGDIIKLSIDNEADTSADIQAATELKVWLMPPL